MQPHDRTRDRRTRKTFWIDDRIVDDFAPVMGRYPFGSAALAVYAVLARRADRDGDSWPSLGLIAAESGSSARTVHKALRLLELLGLVEIAVCYEQGSQRQTSNLYTLLTPPDLLPNVEPDPKKWPEPQRRSLLVRGSDRSQAIAAARREQRALAGARPAWAGLVPIPEAATPRNADTLPPARFAPPRCQPDTPPPATRAPLEGNPIEGNTPKEGVSHDNTTRFVIAEVGLSNRQVWAAALGELGKSGRVSRGDVETWLRPAALIGRDGETLIVGAPNAVARDRISRRLLPQLRTALGAAIGHEIGVEVIVGG